MIVYDFDDEKDLIGCNLVDCVDCSFESVCHASDFEVAGTVAQSEGVYNGK